MNTPAPEAQHLATDNAHAQGRRHETAHRFLVQPADGGIVGTVDGGKLLEWIDKVGYAAAAQWSGSYCVTAYVGNIHLQRPISVGELVELRATVIYTGRTSVHILVTVYSTDPSRAEPVQASQCLTIFVAVGDDGTPAAVPAWNPVTTLELQRHRQARARIPMREKIEAAMAVEEYTADGTAPHATLRFLAAPTDVNWGGKAHGGRIMHWIDQAGYVCGAEWVKAQVICAYIGGIRFYRPIHIGHSVEVTARLIHTGERSMHLSIHVTTTDPLLGTPALAVNALAVFVSLDCVGKPRPIRKWEPVSVEDLRLDQHARDLIGLRELAEPFTCSAGGQRGDTEPITDTPDVKPTPTGDALTITATRAQYIVSQALHNADVIEEPVAIALVDRDAELIACIRTAKAANTLLTHAIRLAKAASKQHFAPATTSTLRESAGTRLMPVATATARIPASHQGVLAVAASNARRADEIAQATLRDVDAFDERHRGWVGAD